MQAPTSSFGCFDLNCVPCHGDKEWQDQRIWVETEVDGDTSVDHLFHEQCAPNVNDSGRFEDGTSHYGWPSLECAGCGENLLEETSV